MSIIPTFTRVEHQARIEAANILHRARLSLLAGGVAVDSLAARTLFDALWYCLCPRSAAVKVGVLDACR